jgi:hypothetical protein
VGGGGKGGLKKIKIKKILYFGLWSSLGAQAPTNC